MRVTKRGGTSEEVNFEKITERIKKLSWNLPAIDASLLVSQVASSIIDGIATEAIDQLTAEIAISKNADHPDYGKLAARIAMSNLHKKTSDSVIETFESMSSALDPAFLGMVHRFQNELQDMIEYKRDYDFDFFGIKTLERMYCTRIDGVLIERPQHVYLRVALALCGTSMSRVKETYDLLSMKFFTHASPTLFNAGMKVQQMASCFLDTSDDSLDGIFECFHRCARISKFGGGLGINISAIRSKGAPIRSTNGNSDGIIPMLKVANNVASYVNQCFVPETPVYSKKGVVRMDEVVTGDSLVTRDGTFKRVNEVFVRDVENEPMFTLVPKFGFEGITCTGVHEIYCLRGQKQLLNYSTIRNRLEKGYVVPEFCPAKDLVVGDFVGFPIPGDVSDYDFSDDFCRFYGAMLGDGHITVKQGKYLEYGISLNTDSKAATVEFIESMLRQHGVHFWTSSRNNTYFIRWSTNAMGLDYDMLYDEDKEKRIDHRFLNLPRSKTTALIKGLLETDGSVGGEIYFSTSSRPLLMGLRYLCLRHGVLTQAHARSSEVGSSHEIRPGEYITTRKVPYVLRIPKHPGLQGVAEFTPYTKFAFFEYEGMVYTRLVNITHSHYTGDVYDFNMESNHNYTTDGGLVHNSGKRKGSMAVYLEPHHPDVFDFLNLKRPGGDEEMRCRDLFLAMWVSDEFMRRVEAGAQWSLLDPFACPGLDEAYGDAFTALYKKYEDEGKAVKVVDARDVWNAILTSQIESGVPYILNKDACNMKSNQQNVGTIKSSNLCVAPETLVLTRRGDIRIDELCGSSVEVWNGEEWSEVLVRQTHACSELVRVTFSDGGSPLECTPYHKFYIDEGFDIIVEKRASELVPGDRLLGWTTPDGFYDMPAVSIKGVEYTGRMDATYCFNEPKRHMGVFNGILTGNCAEIIEYSSPGEEVAVCTLASIGLPAFVKNGVFDFDELHRVTRIVARNLDTIIDINHYPIEHARVSNTRHRPIGIGIQGLADTFIKLRLPFDSHQALAVNQRIMATMYHAALEMSTELSSMYGPYASYEGSPASRGLLQYDLWNVKPLEGLDWDGLKRRISMHGLRNSLSIALMPTASTAQLLGNSEAAEPVTSFYYVRRTLAGEYACIHKHLLDDLVSRGLWNPTIKNGIVRDGGSIQNIFEIPKELRELYKTSYDLKQRVIIDQAAARGPYVCQSMSMNLFVAAPTFAKLTAMHFHSWKAGLKTINYYLRSKAASRAAQVTVSASEEDEEEDACVHCSG